MKHRTKYNSLREKVYDFIVNRRESNGCWLPPKNYVKRNPAGYFSFLYKKKQYALHKLVLEFMVLKRPLRKGFETCHIPECPNHDCFNPQHIYEGTRSENQLDRGYVGRVGHRKLMDDDVRFIREMYATGRYSLAKLASMFEVTSGAINHVLKRKTFDWVE